MAMTIYDRLKGIVSYKLLEQVAKMASEGDESKLAFLFETISRLSPAKYHRETFHDLAEMVRVDHPFVGVFRRVFQELHPNCRKKLIMNFLVNFVVLSRGVRDRKEKELGIHIPNLW